jgi:hypothetical protein
MVLDLSFAVRQGAKKKGHKCSRQDDEIIQDSVNNTTVLLSPEAPVKELRNVLPSLLDFMKAVPTEEHIHFSKMDLADGYWRMIVEREPRWNFAYVMPCDPGQPMQLVILHALQLGWNKSPAYFCATTETVQDVAQTWTPRLENPGISWRVSRCQQNQPARQQSSVWLPHQMSAV